MKNNKAVWAILAVVFVIAVQPLSAQAFSYASHAVICDLAYDGVEPDTRARIDELVARSGEAKQFAQLCGWPDRVRKEFNQKHTSVWHYINVARNATHVSKSACPSQGCVTRVIPEMLRRLRASPQDDWQALAFLGHMVGDLHQPMHVSYAYDRGGNKASLYFEGERKNLHALWDYDVPGLTGTLQRDRALIESISTAGIPLEGSPEQWATESLQKTRSIYADFRRNVRLSEDDILEDQAWLRQRLHVAGLRLAALLDEALGN